MDLPSSICDIHLTVAVFVGRFNDAAFYLKDLVWDREISMRVDKKAEGGILYVTVFDTHGDRIDVNRQMVTAGYARVDHKSKDPR